MSLLILFPAERGNYTEFPLRDITLLTLEYKIFTKYIVYSVSGYITQEDKELTKK